jgi:hypothetical protein
MKIGDLVTFHAGKTGIVTEIYESKLWRTDQMGKRVRWGDIEEEPFARVMTKDGCLVGLPQIDLEVISEAR